MKFHRNPRFWLPAAIVALGAVLVALLVATRPAVEHRPVEEMAPLVRIVVAQPGVHRYVVRSQGTVRPRTESELIPQVTGLVEWVSPRLVSGGFFEEGDPLVRIERTDYELELQSARAGLARARSEADRARTELERQHKLLERGVASRARVDDAENAERVAAAMLREARARLARARSDLERTEIRAPYRGRVRAERVDVGQLATRGQSLATLYATDLAEVSLPVPDRELHFLDSALTRALAGIPDESGNGSAPVHLHADFAGAPRVWLGRIVRSEGEIDPRTRMVKLVAAVEDPYGATAQGAGAPLAAGLFVTAEIEGRQAEGVFVLPNAALRISDPMKAGAPEVVHVIDENDRLRIRPVEVLRIEREQVVIGAGLEPGERVSVSPLAAVIDGMRVRVLPPEDENAREPARAAADGGRS